jgi:hypothetical protein
MKNKLTENDPRLTAYALGELPRNEAEEIARYLDAPLNGPLKREVNKIDALSVMLTQTLNEGNAETTNFKLSPSQRDAIFRSAKAPMAKDVSSAHQSAWLRPVIVTLALAAVVTISFMVLYNVESEKETLTEKSFDELTEDILSAPIQPSEAGWEDAASVVSSEGIELPSHDRGSAGVSVGSDSEHLIKLVENEWVSRSDKAVTRIPLVCGKASWNWVKSSILEDGLLPDKNAIRVEEILNAFSYEEPSDLVQRLTTSGVELVTCPWDAECMIAVILVKNTHSDSIEIESSVTFSESVEQYRLVGYAKSASDEQNIIAPAKIKMDAGENHLVMYEIKTIAGIEDASDVLSLNIRSTGMQEDTLINEDESLKVQFSDRSWTKAVQDVEFALIIADWCRVVSASNDQVAPNSISAFEMIHRFQTLRNLTDEQSKVIEILVKGLEIHKSTVK